MEVKLKKYFAKGRFQRTRTWPASPEKPKNALIKAYWTSIGSLMLCVTMFFGTTMAWFSDEVTVSDNLIDAGSLQVGLSFQKKGDIQPANLRSNERKVFDSDVPWAPGYTAVRQIKVENRGTLNMNYIFTFRESGSGGESGWNPQFARCFEVYVSHNGSLDSLPATYQELQRSADWSPVRNIKNEVATLQDVINQKLSVTTGYVPAQGNQNTDNTDTFLVALHMREDTDRAEEPAQQQLTLGVHLIGYQSGNQDDLGTYDNLVMVQNEAELQDAWAPGKTIVLSNDITMEGSLTVEENNYKKPVQLDLNGKTLTLNAPTGADADTNGTIVVKSGKLVISDRSLANTASPGGKIVTAKPVYVGAQGAVVMNGGTVNGFRLMSYTDCRSTLTMNGGRIKVDSGYAVISNGSEIDFKYGSVDSGTGKAVLAAYRTTDVKYSDNFRFVPDFDYDISQNETAPVLTVNGEAKPQS